MVTDQGEDGLEVNEGSLGPGNVSGRLELAYLGSAQPVQFSERVLKAQTSVELKQFLSETDWLNATVVDDSGVLLRAETVTESCGVLDLTNAKTWRVPGDVETIQGAIELASPGDTVKVDSGTYYEHLRLSDGIRLVGSGAGKTILDGAGEAQNLIEVVGGHNVLVQGFTLRGVEQTDGCATADVTQCSGHWYTAAIYVAPDEESVDSCGPPSVNVVQNIIEDNDVGMMVYFQPYVVVRNNVFKENRVGFVANHHGSGTGLVGHNLFFKNEEHALILSASYIDVVNNIFAENGVACEHEYVQRGRVSCNVFANNLSLGGTKIGMDGNVEVDPVFVSAEEGNFALDSDSPARTAGCQRDLDLDQSHGVGGAGGEAADVQVEAGIYGGLLGSWTLAD